MATTITNIKCFKCKKKITSRHYLKCSKCKNSLDLECANVTFKFFNIMEKKATWKCSDCYDSRKPKTKPSDVQQQPHGLANEPPQTVLDLPTTKKSNEIMPSSRGTSTPKSNNNHTQEMQCSNDSSPTSSSLCQGDLTLTTPSPQFPNFVTTRKQKIIVNISTKNSFSSLEDDEEEECETTSPINYRNRSCLELNSCTEDIDELKNQIKGLQQEREAADQQIEKLLQENNCLKRQLNHSEMQVKSLKTLCYSTKKGTPKKIETEKKCPILNKTKTFFDVFGNGQNNSYTELRIPKTAKKTHHLNPEPEVINELPIRPLTYKNAGHPQGIQTRVESTKTVSQNIKLPASLNGNKATEIKRRVIILADETGKNIRNLLEKLLEPNYCVTAFIKSNASLDNILTQDVVSECSQLSKSDYVVILGGKHDENILTLQSSLHRVFDVLSNTNILYNIPYTSPFKQNIVRLCRYYSNVFFSELYYTNRNVLHRNESSKALVRDMIRINYDIKYFDSELDTAQNNNVESTKFFRI